MKIVGTAKGKAPKAWCLMKDTVTGHYYVGWDGEWPINGGHEAVNKAAQEARDTLGDEPDLGVDVAWPGFHGTCRPSHIPQLTQEQIDQWAEYEASNKRKHAHSQWLKKRLISQIEALDHTPIFESGLRFIGYTRGRSSVTMQFEAENGQIIEFGPSGISGLIQGIIDGRCPSVTLTGTYLSEGDWNAEKQEYENQEEVPRGKGILARFKFAKKGANTYAELEG
jgi:hypothetical protein